MTGPTAHTWRRHRDHVRPWARLGGLALLFCLVDARAMDCVVSTTGVAFGLYDPVATTPTDSAGNLTVRCTHTGIGATRATYTVALSQGNSGSYAQRQLRSGAAVLNYNLFDSAARTRVWGNGTAGSALVGGSILVNPGRFSTNEVVHVIYGRMPAQQAADTGSYSDTILVTVSF